MEQFGFVVDVVQHLQIDPTLLFDRFLSDCISRVSVSSFRLSFMEEMEWQIFWVMRMSLILTRLSLASLSRTPHPSFPACWLCCPRSLPCSSVSLAWWHLAHSTSRVFVPLISLNGRIQASHEQVLMHASFLLCPLHPNYIWNMLESHKYLWNKWPC